MATHELHSSPETCHWGYFDSKLAPRLRIKSGDIATIHCLSGSKEILPEPPMNVLPEHREVLSKLTPHLDPRRFDLASAERAYDALTERTARGKIVVEID